MVWSLQAVREGRDMDQRIIALYDDFTHRHLDRRLFLEQASRLVGGTAAALAPDLMSASGGTPDDEDKARVEFAKVDLAVARKDAIAALAYAKSRPDVNGRTGAVGFCWGGGMVNYLATAVPDLGAGIVYYGRTPPLEEVVKIKAPLLLHYAGLDEALTATVPAYEEALKKAGKTYTLYVYPG